MDKLLILLPGAINAITSVAVGYPFDLIKTHMQSGKYKNSYDCFIKLYDNYNIRNLYRGSSTILVSTTLKRSCQFPIYDYLNKDMNINRYLSGGIASSICTILYNPLQVIKINSQINSHNYLHSNHNFKIYEFIKDRYHNHGFKGFYRGFEISIFKDFIFGASFLGTYDYLKNYFLSYKYISNTGYTFTCAALAASSTWLLFMPLDFVKTSIQKNSKNIAIKYIIFDTYHNKGLLFFWKGCVPMCIRTIPVAGISMINYEYVKKIINK